MLQGHTISRSFAQSATLAAAVILVVFPTFADTEQPNSTDIVESDLLASEETDAATVDALYETADLSVSNVATSESEKYVEGKHYLVIPTEKAEESKTGDVIEVIEFFSYGCIHCYRFEPYIEDWLKNKPDGVEFKREHVVFVTSWIPLAQAFYVAQELDVLSKVHSPLFKAIHDRSMNMQREELLSRLFDNTAEIDPETFDETFWSREVLDKIRSANSKLRDWRVTGTPALVVDGKYVIDTESAGNEAREMFKIVDFLVEKIQEEEKEAEGDSSSTANR